MDFNKPGVQVFLGSVVRPGTHKGQYISNKTFCESNEADVGLSS